MGRRMMIASMWCSCTSDTPWVPINKVSLEWLFTNASILFWADKILVTKQDFDTLHMQSYFNDDVDRECAQILFERLRDEGIIELFNPDIFLNPITVQSITEQVEIDEQRWGIEVELLDQEDRVDHNTIQIGGRRYCPPVIQGVYGSLTLARFLNCSCVFDDRERQFLEDRFANINDFAEAGSGAFNVFSEWYTVFLPGLYLEHDFKLFCNPERGSTCLNADKCRTNAKSNLKRFIEHLLIGREKPELKRLAQRLDQLETELGPDDSQIRRGLLRDMRREQRNLRLVYPTLRHWTRLTQYATAPAILYGTQVGQPLVWMSAASIAALAEAIHISVDALQERNRWLTLLTKDVEAKK